MCRNEIAALKECHASTSKLKFWACNEVKFAMDRCLKKEKLALLEKLNSDMDEKRKQEDEALQEAMGHTQSFEEFLKTDKTYLNEMKKAKSTKFF